MNIWPMSVALPWEYKTVSLAVGCFIYIPTISFPLLVIIFTTSISSSLRWRIISADILIFPVDSSVTTVYDGGFGGKKANLAAIVDVAVPIFTQEFFFKTLTRETFLSLFNAF